MADEAARAAAVALRVPAAARAERARARHEPVARLPQDMRSALRSGACAVVAAAAPSWF